MQADMKNAFRLNGYQAGSLRYIGRPSIVRLWKFLHTRARQQRLQIELWRE
jgi:hypothetical protein